MPPKKKKGPATTEAAPPALVSLLPAVLAALETPFNLRSIEDIEGHLNRLKTLLKSDDAKNWDEANRNAVLARIAAGEDLAERCRRGQGATNDRQRNEEEETASASHLYIGRKPTEASVAAGFPRSGYKVGIIRYKTPKAAPSSSTATDDPTTTVTGGGNTTSTAPLREPQKQQQQHQREFYHLDVGYFYKHLDPTAWYIIPPSPLGTTTTMSTTNGSNVRKVSGGDASSSSSFDAGDDDGFETTCLIGPEEAVKALYASRVPAFLEAPYGEADYDEESTSFCFPILLVSKEEWMAHLPPADLMPTDPNAITYVGPEKKGGRRNYGKPGTTASAVWSDLPFLRRFGPEVLYKPSYKWIRRIHLKSLPMLESIGDHFARENEFVSDIQLVDLPNLRSIGADFLNGGGLKFNEFQGLGKADLVLSDLPKLEAIGENFCYKAQLKSMTLRDLPSLTAIGPNFCAEWLDLQFLKLIHLPKLAKLGENFCARTTVYHWAMIDLPKLNDIGPAYSFFDHGCVGDLKYRLLPVPLLRLLLQAHYEDWKSSPSTYLELDPEDETNTKVIGRWKMIRIPGTEDPEVASAGDGGEGEESDAGDVEGENTPKEDENPVRDSKRSRDPAD